MSANSLDVLIFVPLILTLPPLWLVPWERWIPDKTFNTIIGPYLLYCAFAIWHFKEPGWAFRVVGLMGATFSATAAYDLRKARILKKGRERRAKILEASQDWPVVEGLVLHNHRGRDADGLKVNLSYMYKVNSEEFFGNESFKFANEGDAQRFESRCRERKIRIHYQQDKPEICVLDQDEL